LIAGAALLAVAEAGFGWPDAAAAQCAMCKTALTNSAEGRELGEQFNRGILVLVGAPYLVFGVVGAALFRVRLASAGRRLRERLFPAAPRPRS
jgi:hypothetical protein